MRDVLARYWVVVHISLLAVFLVWIPGSVSANLYSGIPWLCLAVLEMTLLLPSPRKNETLAMARARVSRSVFSDPLLTIGAMLCLYLLLQYWNGGRTLAFDAVSNQWVFSPPPVRWGPFCVDPGEALQPLYWFLPVFAVALGIRHGTNRQGKLILLRTIAGNGALFSLFGLAQYLSGTTSLFWMIPTGSRFFASFHLVNQAGAFFNLMFAVNLGLLVQAFLQKEDRWHTYWLGPALVLNFCGALFSMSRSGILFALLLLLCGGVYCMRHIWRQVETGVRFRMLSIYAVVLVAGATFLFFLLPENPILRQLHTIDWAKLDEGIIGVRWLQIVTAWRVWLDAPVFGVGGGGYHHFACLLLDEPQRALLHNGAAVGNDLLQFLVEHGLLGVGLMLGGVAVLLAPVIRRLRLAHMTNVDGWIGEPWLLFRVSPVTILILAGTTLIFFESLIDLPFRSPAILITWVIALVCAPAFLATGSGALKVKPQSRTGQALKNKAHASTGLPADLRAEDAGVAKRSESLS